MPTNTPVQAPPNAGLGNGIRATGENDYEIPRTEIDRTLANLNDVAMQARIVPAFKDGQAQGFKLFSIRPDSIYSKIGVQNGDVIKRINGFELNSPEKALEVYTKLKEASRIEIDIERLRVIVLNNGRKEYIDNQPGDGAVAAYTPPPLPNSTPVQAPPNAGLGNGIREIGRAHV